MSKHDAIAKRRGMFRESTIEPALEALGLDQNAPET